MINKVDSAEIPEEDAIELSQICPSIAEILNFCELARNVTNVSMGLQLTMGEIQEAVHQSSQQVQHPIIPQVMYHVDNIDRSIKQLVETKKQSLFESGSLVNNIFEALRRRQESEMKAKRKMLDKMEENSVYLPVPNNEN